MDALDRLIELSHLQGALDLRCLLGGQWELDHPREPDGEALYHVVLAGSCILRLRGRPDVVLKTGDIAMLPHGDAHMLVAVQLVANGDVTAGGEHRLVGDAEMPAAEAEIPVAGAGRADAGAKRPDAKEAMPAAEEATPAADEAMQSHSNGVVTIRSNCGETSANLDLLCGRFSYAANALLIDVLPDVVKASFTGAVVPDLAGIVGMIRREAEFAKAGAQSIISSLSTTLFTMLLRAHLEQQPSAADVLALLANARLGPSVIAMLERPAEKWTIEMLAAQSAMSRATYIRAFSALTTDSPMVLLGRIRMQLAGVLLTRTARSVAEIAEEVGYQSESAFSRKFKEAFGVGPGRFRQSRGKESATEDPAAI
jgi:AraC family transcriptional activator of mtrCDE